MLLLFQLAPEGSITGSSFPPFDWPRRPCVACRAGLQVVFSKKLEKLGADFHFRVCYQRNSGWYERILMELSGNVNKGTR